jgi:predicted  nucleic acid-binding Zn-ribbon protein
MAQRSAAERARHAEEMAKLRGALEEAGAVERHLTEQLEQARSDADEANKALQAHKQTLATVDLEKSQVIHRFLAA